VTGGNGFIGSTLIPELVRRGHEIWVFERYKPTYGLPRPVPTLYGDVTIYHSIQHTIEAIQPEVVIHLAAISTADIYPYENWEEAIKIHTLGTANVAEAARRTLGEKLRRFLSASSSEVYGQQNEFPLTEDMRPNPNTPYSTGKVGAELYLRYMIETFDFPAVILRPFNTIGTMPRRTVVERTVRQMLDGGPVRLGDPDAIRDFLWIDDHVSAYIACLEDDMAVGETFNFCTNRGVSISEMVEIAKKIVGYDGEVVWGTQPRRPNDIRKLLGSYEKAKLLLDWEPTVSLEEGIKRMCKAWKPIEK